MILVVVVGGVVGGLLVIVLGRCVECIVVW